jgi:sugar/nucleoside kinase (ribokinase family)
MTDFVAFGLILDDIVLADGTTHTGVLGGGGPQAAFGMRLWSERVGLAARVGADLPEAAWRWLRAAGIDTTGVVVTAWPTLRATQRLDAAGRRRHMWRVPPAAVPAQLARSAGALPAAYRQARGWHLGLHPEEPDLALFAALGALGGRVSVEPFRPAERPLAPGALSALLRSADIFSPNQAEAASLLGAEADEPPEHLAQRLLAAGASLVALRLGAAGALVATAGRTVRLPALPVRVVDPVGAGNAYCGGFLTGWADTGDLVEAGLRGAVAAAFVLEQVGLPAFTPGLADEARARLARLREQV